MRARGVAVVQVTPNPQPPTPSQNEPQQPYEQQRMQPRERVRFIHHVCAADVRRRAAVVRGGRQQQLRKLKPPPKLQAVNPFSIFCDWQTQPRVPSAATPAPSDSSCKNETSSEFSSSWTIVDAPHAVNDASAAVKHGG
jgi:hypothetical protein